MCAKFEDGKKREPNSTISVFTMEVLVTMVVENFTSTSQVTLRVIEFLKFRLFWN